MTTPLIAIVKWLAEITEAEVEGNELQSQTLVFRPKHRPSAKLLKKEIEIYPGSMTASSVLYLYTVLPVLLFIGGDPKSEKPIDLRIEGATNCLDAPSYEYLDQIFFPALESYFGIKANRKLVRRGWGQMTPDPRTVQKGTIHIKVMPLEWGTTLKLDDQVKLCDEEEDNTEVLLGDIGVDYGSRSLDITIKSVTATIIAPEEMHKPLKEALTEDIGNRFPGVDIDFTIDTSGHIERVYVMLVGKAKYCRWGRDYINSKRLKDCNVVSLSKDISSKLTKSLEEEVNCECPIDQYLQDQLVIYQCLAEGRSSFPRSHKDQSTEFVLKNLHPDFPLKEDSPTTMISRESGTNDSQTTQSARYSASMVLSEAHFYNEGKVCIGAGIKAGVDKKVQSGVLKK